MDKPCVIGITGIIGSGKSAVGKILTALGELVFDTDQIVHDLFTTSDRLRTAVKDRFGPAILTDSGAVDRAKLGQIVFDDPVSRQDLEAIMHPAVIQECAQLVAQNSQSKRIFFLVPLLFEAHLEGHYDRIWSVTAAEPILKQRLKERNGYSDAEIDKRFAAQMSQQEKCSRSDLIIDNSGSLENTQQQVEKALNAL